MKAEAGIRKVLIDSAHVGDGLPLLRGLGGEGAWDLRKGYGARW